MALMLISGVVACSDVHVDPFHPIDSGSGGDGGTTITCPPPTLLGYASINPGTTGGGNAAHVVVTNLADLSTAAMSTDPMVIEVQGMIVVPQGSTFTLVPVGSNKTIVGADGQSGIMGAGLDISAAQNVIVQNLIVAFADHTSAILIENGSKYVWIDHCELYSDQTHTTGYYEWLVDIKNASDFVTVSWTYFHDHFNTAQIGHSDDSTIGAMDMMHLSVTYHHNRFVSTKSGAPRVRWGSVHVANNHMIDVSDYAVASEDSAQVLVEKNVFDQVSGDPVTTQQGISTGTTGAVGVAGTGNDNNIYNNTASLVLKDQLPFTLILPYTMDLDSTLTVPTLVDNCAGVGKI
jgi:pectate lyase